MHSTVSLVLCSLAFWAIAVHGDSDKVLVRKRNIQMSVSASGVADQVKELEETAEDPIEVHDTSERLVRKHNVQMSVSASGVPEEFEQLEETEEPMAGSAALDVLADVQAMASSGEKVEKDKIKIIQKIVADELEPDLIRTHQGSVKQIGINLAAINTCNTDAGSTLDKIKTTTEAKIGQRRTVHADCREKEKVKNSTKGKRCTALDDFLNMIAQEDPVAVEPAGKPRDPMVKYVQTMSGYYCPPEEDSKGDKVTELDDACKLAEKEHASHKDKCNSHQREFESGFCVWRTQLMDTCAALDTCYDSSVKIFKDYVSVTKDLVKKWKVEYTALKKILCYVDVWLSDNNASTVSANQYKKCEEAKVDTSPMDVKYPEVPKRATCDLTAVQTYPGSKDFKTVEYSKFIDYINPAVVSCVPSVLPVVPETPAPAPPTEFGMSLLGNGCCRFDGWKGKNHGYQTEGACQKICADTKDCIAADTARPRGDKYDCYTFYGSGKNFNLQCGKSNVHEKCFKKVVKEGKKESSDPSSAAAQNSIGQMTFVGNGCCRFDRWKAHNHGYTTETACQKLCSDKDDCVAADLARPRGDTFHCFTFYGTGKNFRTECGTSNTDEKCYRNTKLIPAGHSK